MNALELDCRALENAWVRLDPLVEAHRASLRAVGGDETLWRYFLSPDNGQGRFAGWFDEALARIAQGDRLTWAVFDHAQRRHVGSTSVFLIDPPNLTVEIGGTWYHETARGGAVNPACKRLLFEIAFAGGAARVELKTDARNAQSRAALAKLGAVEEGVWRRRHILPDGFARDTVYFSVLADDWPDVRARLDARLAACPAPPAAAEC